MLSTRCLVFYIIYVMLSKFIKRLKKNILFVQINCSEHKNVSLHYLLPLLLLCPFGSNSALQLHKLLSTVSFCSFCHCMLVSLYCTVLALSPHQLLISHCQKSWSVDPWCVHLLGREHEDWWPCGCFAARVRKLVHKCSIATANRTAQKMKHVAFRKTLRWNNCPCARFHFKTFHLSGKKKKNRCGSNRSCLLALKETPVNI